jgi:hypothetical protein
MGMICPEEQKTKLIDQMLPPAHFRRRSQMSSFRKPRRRYI